MSGPVKIEVFYDYACPYVYAGAMWLRDVKANMGDDLQINWRYFPLEQVNSAEGPEWKLWEQAPDYASRGRTAFHGAIAAKRQGSEAFERFHYGLLAAKHEDGKNHGRLAVVREVAESAGLDMEQFDRDLADYSLLAEIGTDYEYAHDELGVFGTPTLVFPDGSSSYVKMYPPAPEDECMDVWNLVASFVTERPYFAELKRPSKPSDDD